MTMKQSFSQFCPVPEEQQPAREYEELKDSWLFNWTTLPTPVYRRKLIWLTLIALIIMSPITAASFNPGQYPIKFIHGSLMAAGLLPVLVLIRMYLGWVYVQDRLQQPTICYEESGWYDGQIWQKTPEMIDRDRLIINYEIEPILQRLKKTGAILGLLYFMSGLIWFISTNISN